MNDTGNNENKNQDQGDNRKFDFKPQYDADGLDHIINKEWVDENVEIVANNKDTSINFQLNRQEPRFTSVLDTFFQLFEQKALIKVQQEIYNAESKKAWKKIQKALGLDFSQNIYNLTKVDDNWAKLVSKPKQNKTKS